MQRKHNTKLTPLAQHLRKTMTLEERILWYDFLRQYPVRFQRQKILGQYIADFYCAEAKLVVEIDGSQHWTDSGEEYDTMRTSFLESYGLKVIRFPNWQIRRGLAIACQYIDQLVRESLAEQGKDFPEGE